MAKSILIDKIKVLTDYHGEVEFASTDKYLYKDDITGEWLHQEHNRCYFYPVDIEYVRKGVGAFDPNSISTRDQYQVVQHCTVFKNHKIALAFPSIDIKLFTLGGAVTKIYPKDIEAFIEKLDLVTGINNPEIYFNRRELALLDKPKPYRKFDNTYYKRHTSDVIDVKPTPAVLRSKEYQELQKSILKRNIEMGVESLTYKEFEGLKNSYGLELECANGRLEENEVSHLNVKAVHDGSLREADGNVYGGEYVTGVLVGDAGLMQLNELCRVLQTKCTVDKKCGVHAHIGSLNWSNEDIVYSYILAQKLEVELFSILPKSRRDNQYCRPLRKLFNNTHITKLSNTSPINYQTTITDYFNVIFREVSGLNQDGPDSNYNKYRNHPKGSKCGYDKSSQRYCWLNYVTLLFNTKEIDNSWTLEFRPMSGTLNFTKIKNWLKICLAFCAFVENHKQVIRNGYYTDAKGNKFNLSLELVIKLIYPKTGDKLIDYIRERKQLFQTADESVDYEVDRKLAKKSIKEVICA